MDSKLSSFAPYSVGIPGLIAAGIAIWYLMKPKSASASTYSYLQILLSDYIPGMGRQRMLQDMDEWGYSFRLGSAGAWFEQDAEDAQAWLIEHELIGQGDSVTFRLRQDHGY